MPKRLSRAESKARTQERLVDAATSLFLRDGFQATKVDDIAEAAGYSRGAVYSNFETKEDLGLAVLDRHSATQFEAISAAVGEGTFDERLAALADWIDAVMANRDWALLKVEITVQARQEPRLQEQLAKRDRTARRAVAGLIDRVTTETDVVLPIPSESLAAGILAATSGLATQQLVEPDSATTWVADLLTATRFLFGNRH